MYDIKALDARMIAFIQRKFGRPHVNRSEVGVSIGEVTTIVSGGLYIWFFVFPQDVVGKLGLGRLGERGLAWRISYPSLVPHGGFFDAAQVLVVAYANCLSSFVMRYEDASVDGTVTLNGNPWIDFDGPRPALLAMPRAQAGDRSVPP